MKTKWILHNVTCSHCQTVITSTCCLLNSITGYRHIIHFSFPQGYWFFVLWPGTVDKTEFIRRCFEACCHVWIGKRAKDGQISLCYHRMWCMKTPICQDRCTSTYFPNGTRKWHIVIAASIYQSNILLSLIKQRYGLARRKGKDRGGGCRLILFLGSTPLVCPFLPAQWRLNVSVEKWKI